LLKRAREPTRLESKSKILEILISLLVLLI